MANKFPKRGDFNIPTAVIDEYQWATDSFIDDFGRQCTLIYPPIDSQCPNCIFDPVTKMSANIYKDAGPVPFENHTVCPMCGGAGRSQTDQTEVVKLRVYTSPKEFLDIGMRINMVDGIAQIIGYMTDYPKIQRTSKIILFSNVAGVNRWICEKYGEAVPYGFGERYFIMYVKRLLDG